MLEGSMHTAMGSVLVTIHGERSIPPPGSAMSELQRIDDPIIRNLENEEMLMYALSSQDLYYRLYEICQPPSRMQVYL